MFDQILLGAERGLSSKFAVFGEGEGHHAGNKGGGHRGAAQDGVATGRVAGGDLISGGHHIHLSAAGGETREAFPAVDRADRDHFGKTGGITHGI